MASESTGEKFGGEKQSCEITKKTMTDFCHAGCLLLFLGALIWCALVRNGLINAQFLGHPFGIERVKHNLVSLLDAPKNLVVLVVVRDRRRSSCAPLGWEITKRSITSIRTLVFEHSSQATSCLA